VTVRAMPPSEQFDLVNQPAEKRPDMMLSFVGGDAFHLDTSFRIMFRTGAAPLNYYQYSNPELDKLMDDALLKPTPAEMNAVYAQMCQLLLDDGIMIPMCLPPTSAIAHTAVTGYEVNSFFPQVVDYHAAKKS